MVYKHSEAWYSSQKPKKFWGSGHLSSNRSAGMTKKGTKDFRSSSDNVKEELKDRDKANEGQDKD